MPVEYLSQFDVLQIRTKLAAQLHESFDEWNLHGLQTALAAPKQAMFGEELRPSLWDKAATLLIRLIVNHPFYDGNKRIAFLSVSEFLRRNGYDLQVAREEASAFTRAIALGNVDASGVETWLEQHTKPRTKN